MKTTSRSQRVLAATLGALLVLPVGLPIVSPRTAAAVRTYAEAVLYTPDLVSYWQLTEAEGDFVDLRAGHGAVPSGEPERLSSGPLPGPDAGAVGFPSAGDYLTVTDHEDLDLADGPFSIEVWLRRDVDSGTNQIVLSKQAGGYVLGIDPDDRLYFGQSGGQPIVAEEGETPADGTWHHVVLTRVGIGSGNTRLYKDGAEVTVELAPSISLTDTDEDLVVGRETSASPLGGSLAHLAIYGRALEASEVAGHYAAARDPCPAYGAWVIYGTSGNDVIVGTTGDDVICGLSGNDEIDGGGGNDVIFGGPGNDTISTTTGRGEIDGGTGDDLIDGGPGPDTIFGGPGNDEIHGGADADRLYGGSGDDDLAGDDGDDFVIAESGTDELTGGAGDDSLDGGTDADALVGGDGDDLLIGGPGADAIDGGDGGDLLVGGEADDNLAGGPGNDELDGDGGDDGLVGGPGDDVLNGHEGTDELDGGIGTDTCFDGNPVDCEATTDPLAVDGDADGLVDGLEARLGTDPDLADTDGDGLGDRFEALAGGYDHLPTLADTDGDTVPDAEEDVDGDGLPTAGEAAHGSSPLARDSDLDGLDDPDEVAAGTDPASPDTDADGLPDGSEEDTDPLDPDSDDDLILDGDELRTATAEEGSLVAAATGTGDIIRGLRAETASGDTPAAPGQALPAYQLEVDTRSGAELAEATLTFTYDDELVEDEAALRVYTLDPETGLWLPAAPDLDQIVDTESNTVEVTVTHFSAFTLVDEAAAAPIWSQNGAGCWLEDDTDTDGDGLADCEETGGMQDPSGYVATSNPEDVDSDDDGLDDGVEVTRVDLASIEVFGRPLAERFGASHVYVLIGDPLDPNSDGDPDTWSAPAADDRVEFAEGSSPRWIDADGDGVGDATELAEGLDPLTRDTDGDGRTDGDEFTRFEEDGSFDPLVAEAPMTPAEWAARFAKGVACGDLLEFCPGVAADDVESVPYLLGSVAGAFGGPAVDGRDVIGSLAHLDLVGAAANVAGLIPVVGDAAQGARRIIRALERLPPERQAGVLAAVARLDVWDEHWDDLVDLATDGALRRLYAHGLDAGAARRLLAGRPPADLKALADALDGAAGVSVRGWLPHWREGERIAREELPPPGFLDRGHGFADPGAPPGARRSWRILDAWNKAKGIAREVKVGYQGASPAARARILAQIEKDAALLAEEGGAIKCLEWHFFASDRSGTIGAHPEIIARLQELGIPYYIHLPYTDTPVG